jgi:hypothetical protein
MEIKSQSALRSAYEATCGWLQRGGEVEGLCNEGSSFRPPLVGLLEALRKPALDIAR